MFSKIFLTICLFFILNVSATLAAGPITIEKVSETFDPKTKIYTYTVVIKNTGRLIVDYFVTAQPYDDKALDAAGKPKDSAKRQVKKVNLGGEQKTTVKFEFSGAEGKNWKFKYTDVYTGDPSKGGKFVTGDIGDFALRPVQPGPSLDQALAMQFPYPYAVYVQDFGPTDFYVEVTQQSLPPAWALTSFNPIPGELFTLSPREVKIVDMAMYSASPVFAGQQGFVRFDFVNPESGLRWNSELGAHVVPEPATWFLLSSGILAIMQLKRRTRIC